MARPARSRPDGGSAERADGGSAERAGDGPAVRVDVSNRVATVTLDRPARLNAFDGPMVEELIAALRSAADDPAVRCVVLTGAGAGFCAGGDLKKMSSPPPVGASGGSAGDGATEEPLAVAAARIRHLTQATELLHGMPKVTIAAVNGACAGAGLSFACAADLRIAAASAVFTTAFVKAGQTGDYGLTWLLPGLVGTGRARRMLLCSERFDARQAAEMGLVDEVVPDEALAQRVSDLAGQLARHAPLAVAGIKANLNDAASRTLAEQLDVEATRMAANLRTRDAREAVSAFAEHREPSFQGR